MTDAQFAIDAAAAADIVVAAVAVTVVKPA